MAVSREVEVQAPPEEVWDALATEQGRERWLEESERDVEIEVVDAPHRLVWWWNAAGAGPSRVEFDLQPVPAGTRVVVTESVPRLPLVMLASSLQAVLA